MSLIFVDVEACGPCPGPGFMTEFGAVDYSKWKVDPDPKYCAYHGVLFHAYPDPENPAVSLIDPRVTQPTQEERKAVMAGFELWLLNEGLSGRRPVFVSDNPAYDFQWINHAFHTMVGRNPFGHSARSIKDFYAGLTGDFSNSQKWKKLRVTPHDHNPVNDSLGNVEAFDRMLRGER